MSLHMWYVLDEDGRTPIPVENDDPRMRISRNEQEKRRVVRQVTIKSRREEWFVSTIFLGLDHRFNEKDKPLLWESMVFMVTRDGYGGPYQERYSSYEEAIAGHYKAVQWAQAEMRKTPYRNAVKRMKKLPERRRIRQEKAKLNELRWRQEKVPN